MHHTSRLRRIDAPPVVRDEASSARPSPRRLVLLAAAVVGLVAAVLPFAASPAAAARVIHVAPHGDNAASGGPSDPVRTVARAVQLAQSGDAIELASGVYGESVQVYGKQVHIRAGAGADVVFDGAIPVGGFSPSGGDWVTAWDTDFPRAGVPHVYPDNPEAGWPEQFFVDGQPLTEVTSRAAVVPGTFFHDRPARRVWLGDDPAGRLVEGSVLPWGLYFNRAHGSSLTDVTVRRYATGFDEMAAVRAYSDDLSFDGVTVELNAYMGLSMIGNRISVRNSNADRNGHLGFHGHWSTDISVVDSTITNNNREGFDAWHAAGGLKITETTGITITDSFVVNNAGPGLWTDLDCSRVHMARNFVADNMRSGIELELSFDIVVVDNTVVDNGETGVWVLESHDTDVWHNALFGNKRDIWVEDGPRSDVHDVELYANTLGPGVGGTPALLNVDDWTSDRSAAQMWVRGDHNAYWLPPGATTPNLSRWANWPYGLLYGSTIENHRAATGMDAAGTLRRDAANPYVRDTAARDYRMPLGAVGATPLPAVVAAVAGVPAGSQHPAGPIHAWTGRTTDVGGSNPGSGGQPGSGSGSDSGLDPGDPPPPPPTTDPPAPPPAGDTSQPSTPQDLAAAVGSDNSVALSWSASTDDVGVQSYLVYRNNDVIDTQPGSQTSVVLTDLGVGSHWLQVRAVDAAGNQSHKTPPVRVDLGPLDVRAPHAPVDPIAVVDPTTGLVDFSWGEPWDDTGVTDYKVRRNLAPVLDVGATVTSVTLDLGSGGHYLQVEAIDAAGNTSVRTAPVFVEVGAGTPTPPPAVTTPPASDPTPTPTPTPTPVSPSTAGATPTASAGASVGSGSVRGAPAVRLQLRERERTLWSRSFVPVVQNVIGPIVRPESVEEMASVGRMAIGAVFARLHR